MDDVRRYGVEALIVGSDQIWRPVMYDAVKYYFLGFTGDSDILRVAYAPSVALDKWPYKEEVTVKLRELIKKFSAVSVREASSVQLVKENLGVDAQWVFDPTMLLKKEDYIDVCKNEPESKEPFVFAYILDMTDEKCQMAEMTAKILGYSVRYLSADKVKKEDTIEKWLANFRDAKYVITDKNGDTHTENFGLIFQKQFYTFYNTYRGNARMDSLKKISGLEDRFITEPVESPGREIDYADVEEKLEKMRVGSVEYLASALKEKLK